jgi:transposase-like protein
MGKTRPSYPPEFKEEAVRLVRVVSEARWPVPKVARELGLAPETLRSWVRQAEEAGLVPSMGSVADAYDNALAESFVSTLKRELLHCHSWPSREGVRAAIFEYIECFYNPRRRHTPRWAR